jgi:cytochrome d ubiquinol oxidase subunit II
MFDYESLKLIWWVLVGVLLIGFALTDGFDLGAAALMPFVGRTDNERRVVINTIAPHWDGNQVWLITAGGALFAAWPLVYAASFSGFYWAMLLVLFALFVRPVGFDYRSKLENTRWRQTWDWGLFVGGLVPSLVFGVAFGNLLLGVPFQFDADLRVTYYGSFWQLLNPFGLLAGVVSLSMLLLHGATWLMMRTEADVARRSRRAAQVTALVYLVAFIGAGAWLWLGNIQGQVLQGALDTGAALNPLGKQVAAGNAGWMANYAQYPLTKLAPLLGILGAVLALAAASGRKGGFAFLARPGLQPDRVGRRVQPYDPGHHVRGGLYLRADHPRLHPVGLREDVGHGDHRADRQQPPRPVLRRTHHVVLHLDSRCAAGLQLRHHQCPVAGDHAEPRRGTGR